MMFRTVTIVLVACAAVSAGAASAQDGWQGLWQGVDAADGSLDSLAVFPDEDGGYLLLGRVTEHSLCTEDAGEPSAAWYEAKGRVEADGLVRHDVEVACEHTTETMTVPDTVLTLGGDGSLSFTAIGGKTITLQRVGE